MLPPWDGSIGSRPLRPFDASVKFGLLLLVSSEKTHRIWRVSFAQAKSTWLGSLTTFGFWQAIVICFCTVATLAGQPGLPPERTMDSTMTAASRSEERRVG